MFPADFYVKVVTFSSSTEESRVSLWLIKTNFLCALPSSSFVLKYNKLSAKIGISAQFVLFSMYCTGAVGIVLY